MRFYLLGFFLCLTSVLKAQDTLMITIDRADSLFLKNNLQLLAERYQIDIAKSIEIQDRLWNNPVLTAEISTYNPSRGFLDVGKNGQKFFSINQLVATAGKRNKQVSLDMEATRKTELEFYNLVRTLKFDLRQMFFQMYFLDQTRALLDRQIGTLTTTVSAFEKEYERKNISLKELVRLKALLFQLHNDKAAVLFEIAEKQRDLRTYLNIETPVKATVSDDDIRRYRIGDISAASLKARALESRPDLKSAQSDVKQSELNLVLQKAIAVPDLQFGAVYDQQSNYVSHYFGLSATVDLPFFNRNQGNIRAAKSHISYFKTQETARQNQVANEVDAALQKVIVAESAFKSVDTQFTEQFELLSNGIFDNFQKRNITLLEFIDFIESHSESIRGFNKLKADRIKAYEELNFAVGQELFRL